MQKFLISVFSSMMLILNASAGLQDTANALNETIRTADVQAILPGLAEKLGVEVNVAKVALIDKTNKLSDFALAKFVADKTGETLDSVMEKKIVDWSTFFGTNSGTEKEADEYLDALQTEVAFMMLDYREGRKK